MMTRLTPDLIAGVPDDDIDLDSKLMKGTGKTMKELALEAAELDQNTDLSKYTAAVIPITSGMGVIGGFSKSVDAIVRRLGIQSHVTVGTDVQGFSEALVDGVDLIFMADDSMFVAYNVRKNKFISNHFGTALGYSVVLKNAADGIDGKDVLVIGAGYVGSRAAKILRDMGANVSITDKITEKSHAVGKELGISVIDDVDMAISSHKYILNATPAIFPGRLIMNGAVISTPGVPHYFDEEAWNKAKAIIHDPLEIGVATMATCSIAFPINNNGESR